MNCKLRVSSVPAVMQNYHRTRTHLSLSIDKAAPDARPVQLPATATVIEIPEVGGLHRRYERRVA